MKVVQRVNPNCSHHTEKKKNFYLIFHLYEMMDVH